MPGGDALSSPSLAEVEHADWPALERLCATLGLNPKGRSSVVRMRILDHVRRRIQPELWRPGIQHQAALLTRLGHPDAAERLWESTIQLDAPAPWIGMGRAQLGAGDLSEAAKSFERAVQMGEAAAHLHRSEALAATGDYEGAVRACDAYLSLGPQDLRALLLKANFLSRGGWATEASTVLHDAFEAHPDVHELWSGLGALLLRGGRSEAAAEAYREAVRASPEDEGAWINRGAALLLAGQTREAVGALREVLEKDPARASALNNLGVAYLREGKPKSAGVTLERAAKHMETPQILRNLSRVQQILHPRPAARARRRLARPRPGRPIHKRARPRRAKRRRMAPRPTSSKPRPRARAKPRPSAGVHRRPGPKRRRVLRKKTPSPRKPRRAVRKTRRRSRRRS